MKRRPLRLSCTEMVFTALLLGVAMRGQIPDGGVKTDGSKVGPPTGKIIERALLRAEWVRDQGLKDRYTFQVLKVHEDLNGDGEVKESRRELHQSNPVQGQVYRRLLEQDGRALGKKESEKERGAVRYGLPETFRLRKWTGVGSLALFIP